MSAARPEVVIDAMEQVSVAGVGWSALAEREPPFAATADAAVLELPATFDLCDVTGWRQTAEIRQQDPFSAQTVACGKLLLDRIPSLPNDIRRRGVILGSAYGSCDSHNRYVGLMLDQGPANTSPCLFRNVVSNAVLGHLAVAFRFGGVSSIVLSGSVSALYAIGFARGQLLAGVCDVVLTGASDLTSAVIRRRFLSRRPSVMPLIDGSCLTLMRRRSPGEIGQWTVAALAFGRLGGAGDAETFAATLSRALAGAGLRADDIELALVHTAQGALFCGGTEAASTCLGLFHDSQRSRGATALPLMLNLGLTLHALPRRQIPALLGAAPGGSRRALRAASRLLVAAVDEQGALAVGLFVYASASVPNRS